MVKADCEITIHAYALEKGTEKQTRLARRGHLLVVSATMFASVGATDAILYRIVIIVNSNEA